MKITVVVKQSLNYYWLLYDSNWWRSNSRIDDSKDRDKFRQDNLDNPLPIYANINLNSVARTAASNRYRTARHETFAARTCQLYIHNTDNLLREKKEETN